MENGLCKMYPLDWQYSHIKHFPFSIIHETSKCNLVISVPPDSYREWYYGTRDEGRGNGKLMMEKVLWKMYPLDCKIPTFYILHHPCNIVVV